MNHRSMTLVLFLVAAGCSEGPSAVADSAAQRLLESSCGRFLALKQLCRTSLNLEGGPAGFKPVVLPRALTRANSGWRQQGVHHLDLLLPSKASGVMQISSGPITLEVRALNARDASGRLARGALVFRQAYPHADSLLLAERDRVEEFVVLHNALAPRTLEYELRVVRGGGRVRQSSTVVEVLDRKGIAWLRLVPPFVEDSSGVRHEVEARLELGRLRLSLPSDLRDYPALLDPGWTTTGSLINKRTKHTATRLGNGKVLVVGGSGLSSPSAEQYDPASGTWTSAGKPARLHFQHTATLLKTGLVLVAGHGSGAELFNPAKNSWKTTSSMAYKRRSHTATLLKTGKVLVTGGTDHPHIHWTAELYDPAKGTWTTTGSMKGLRMLHRTTLLKTGKVLVTGGWPAGSMAELYDPAKGTWSVTGSMKQKRWRHTATLLGAGMVLVTGGESVGQTAERYDPTKGNWKVINSMSASRNNHTATLLGTGKVLVAGGSYNSPGTKVLSSAELFDSAKGTWSGTGKMNTARQDHTATLLASGRVLVVGSAYSNVSELYDPTTGLACTTGSQCTSGFCADGICCDGACKGTCEQCVVSATGVGSCVKVAQGKLDPATCSGPAKACDGKGQCLLVNGQACASAASCVSGFCVDGACCDAACTGSCRSCDQAPSKGQCKPVTAGKDDTCQGICEACDNGKCLKVAQGKLDPATCSGPAKACNGKGQCLLVNGQACASAAGCASGLCVDGVCCDNACTGACRACDQAASKGQCKQVDSGKDDTCQGTCEACAKGSCQKVALGQQDSASCYAPGKACNGKGQCLLAGGQACAAGASCASGFCVDGVCCDTACSGTCRSCDQAASTGQCSFVPVGQQDSSATKPCTGVFVCAAKGACKIAAGQPCGKPSQCASEFCVDGVCCASACTGNCMSCAVSGSPGTCTPHPSGIDPDNDCLGKDKSCGGKCDGNGKCDFPSIGSSCGTCAACDGTGRCAATPPDDPGCGVIDCDKLDTQCRDYHDLKVKRCDAIGVCKQANSLKACTSFKDLLCGDATGQDIGLRPDQGARKDLRGGAGEEEDAGCGCQVSSLAGSGLLLWPLLLVALRRQTEQ